MNFRFTNGFVMNVCETKYIWPKYLNKEWFQGLYVTINTMSS